VIQLVLPNLNPTLTQGRETITNWSGWCLLHVQSVFGVGWSGSSAWDAWQNRVNHRHTDRNIPSGVYVPIWFDGYDGGKRLGHAAIYHDGRIYTSPYFPAARTVAFNSIEEVERIYGMKYVGWSEDIAGVKVIEEGEEMTTNLTRPQIASLWLLGNLEDLAQINGKDRENIYSYYEALPLQNLISDLTNGERRKAVIAQFLAGANAKADFQEVGVINGEKIFKKK